MEFAKRLQEFRMRAGLSQSGLAEKSGVSVRTLQEYEQGKMVPSIDKAAKLAQALGVSLDELAGIETKKKNRSG